MISAAAVEHDTFAEDILQDLVSQGFSGQELVYAFKQRYADIRQAIAKLNQEADAIASGENRGGEVIT